MQLRPLILAQDVMVKGFVDQVVILCGGEEIARHQRSYGSGTSASAKHQRADDIGGRLRHPHSRQSRMSGKGTVDTMPAGTTSGTPQVLLGHHLKQLKLPTVLREYDKVARECARDGVDHPRYLLRLVELEHCG
jgi:hypothetical protein